MVQRKVIVRGATNQALDELDAADIPDLSAAYEAAGGLATHAGAADPHTGYVLESAHTSAAHDTLGLTTDALLATAVSDHAGLADPHTGYRLESADHSHATTGLQGGTVAHTALTSVGIDDHHARDHAINGAIHTGTLDDAQIPAGITRDAEAAAAYQPLDSDLTAIAALTTTAFGRALLELADAAALGSAHTHSGASTLYAPGTFTTVTGNYTVMADLLELTGVEVGTMEGTAVLALI